MMRPPMFPGPPTRSFSFMNSRFPQQAMYPRPGISGFLSRLLSRGPAMPSSPFFSMPAMQQMSSVPNMTGGGITGMLANVQKMLGIAQNVMPMVQQYGPLVKNLPAMMKIFRELKTADESEENHNESQIRKEHSENKNQEARSRAPEPLPVEATSKKKQANEPKPSTPKLYI